MIRSYFAFFAIWFKKKKHVSKNIWFGRQKRTIVSSNLIRKQKKKKKPTEAYMQKYWFSASKELYREKKAVKNGIVANFGRWAAS